MADPDQPSQNEIYAARPLLTVDHQERAELLERLQTLTVVEDEGGLSSLEATFSAVGVGDEGRLALQASDSPLGFGALLTVGLGEASAPQEVFRGRITGLELGFDQQAPPVLTVLAEDCLAAARMSRRSRVFEDLSLGDLVQRIAQDLGLRASCDGLDRQLGLEVQLDETDLGFLRRVLHRYDADLQVVGDELQAAVASRVRRGALTFAPTGNLLQVRALADLAHQVTEVTWSGFDPAQGQALSARSGAGAHLGPGRGRTGAELLQQKLARRSEHLGAIACATQAEAQALVDAAAGARARRFVRYHALCTGDPRLRVGTEVRFLDMGPRFSNAATVTRVEHRYDQQTGYRCAFIAGSAYWESGHED